MEFDFSEKAKRLNVPGAELIGADIKLSKYMPLVMGRVVDFRPKFNELKVYHGDEELSNEARTLNEQLTDFKTLSETPGLKPITDFFFGQSIPIAPYPEYERCLGLLPDDSSMKIKNGYAILAYDFEIQSTDSQCIFHMHESIAEKKLAMAKTAGLDKLT